MFAPDGLRNTEVGGGDEGLNLAAFTLVPGSEGLELYAAVKNDGDVPLCNAGMVVTFYDETGVQVATLGLGLRTGRLYRLNDESGTITSCVAPGEVAMAGTQSVPKEVVLERLAYLEHNFPAFGLEVTPLDAAVVSGLDVVESADGSVFQGRLTNLLDTTVSSPVVDVFPTNRAGRPLGMASASSVTEIPPGESWSFETSSVEQLGADAFVFATVKL